MASISLALLLHAHQPIGNFEHVLEECYRSAYSPFLEELKAHPRIRLGLHFSGVLLEWLELRHPDYLDQLGELAARGQAELVGGGRYEPILSALPSRDRVAQVQLLNDFLERRFGRRPAGAWLTERVWDPSLPETLARAGIQYTLTDDYHFLSVGLEERQLYGYYLTEWQGWRVKVVPGLKSLRYMLPFRGEGETVEYLRRLAQEHPGALVTMGDDLEKFGSWPETFRHVYTNGWLRRFFEAVEASSDWLTTVPAGEYLDRHPPLGRIYLPTASYQEMMGWALPLEASGKYEELLHRAASMADGGALANFIHGGEWHNFFYKYEEANHLHKRMVDLSQRYEAAGRALPPAGESRQRFEAGYRRLLRAQCNDAYWHGVFGGLYAPHLRTAVYEELLRAEECLLQLGGAAAARRLDFNVDGKEEIFLESSDVGAVITPSDGGTVSELDFRPGAFNVINSLRRRPEAYHAKVRLARDGSGGAHSIHNGFKAKEPGLERYLQYDSYNRHVFRPLLFGPDKKIEDYAAGRLEELRQIAAGPFDALCPNSRECLLRRKDENSGWEVSNRISLEKNACLAEWHLYRGRADEVQAGLELVLNLLAPDAPDRYFELPGLGGEEERPRLNWMGECRGNLVSLIDEWLDLRIDLQVMPPATFWILPIFTVSQSEGGFEKVYQGSAILPHWNLKASAFDASVRLVLTPARQ